MNRCARRGRGSRSETPGAAASWRFGLPMTPRARRAFFAVILFFSVCAVAGTLLQRKVGAQTSEDESQLRDSLKTFSNVYALVEQNYAEPISGDRADAAIYDGAIPGMLRVLDPHSNFFDPRQYSLFKEEQQGKYYGVGMTVQSRENQTVVLAPFVGSPAYKAGIRPADIILRVDGKDCAGLTTNEVADMLKGPKGTTVHITLGREGWDKPIEVTVVRDEIPRPGVEYFTMVKPGIGYAHVSTFNETTDSDLADALRQLDVSKLDGMILDLRNNGGGLLNQAVGMADMFLDKNELVVSHHGRTSPERRYYAVRGNQGIEVPLVVLVNGQSASASEIVAGAIQDHDRGLIVGETSFGKGLVQTQYPLSEDTALLLTTARYYTPSGRLIQRDYKNISLYDYHYNPKPPHAPEVKLTDSGRQVYGEGGITPDVAMAAPKLNDFQQLLLRRGVFYPFQQGVGDFTRYYLGARPEISKEWTPGDAVVEQFRKYLDQQHIKFTEPDIQDNLAWIKGKIKREVFTSAFGLNEGYKVELQSDIQLQKAIEQIPQARALYQNARKIVAERAAQGSARP
jgi:carboxyl-terminal processing protease